MAGQPPPPVGHGFLTVEVPRSHSDTPHSVGLLCTSDRSFAETFYLTTHNIRNRQTSVTPTGFEPAISVGDRPQTYTLDRAATGIGVRANVTKGVWLSRTLNNH